MEIYVVKILNIEKNKFNELCLYVDKSKRFAIDKYINNKDKVRTLLGEVLIRTIISKKLNINNDFIQFEQNEFGKPYLKGNPYFNFNISHSGDYVACGIDCSAIGIDIEEISDIKYVEIARRFFEKNEFNYVIKGNLYTALGRFYEIWTLKESYIKCCGQGLLIPLKSFSVDIDQYGNIKVTVNGEDEKYAFKKFDIGGGYKISVCSLNKEASNNVVMIEQNTLINAFYKICLNK